MKGLSIERMHEAHVPAVIEIERVSFGMPWSRETFLRVIRNPAAMACVAILKDELVGYFCALSFGEEAEILKLAVAPAFRGRGIARSLNSRGIEWLMERGCKTVYLEVRRSNRAAIGLYERFGFRATGIRKGYYSAPSEDALVMRLDLSSWSRTA